MLVDTVSITRTSENLNPGTNEVQDAQPILVAHELVSIRRPSFVKLCKDECMAMLLNHFLYWIAWKCKDEPKSVVQSGTKTYYITAKELAEFLGWCEKKIRMSVNALVKLGIIGQTYSQKYKMDRTKHFFFGVAQYKKLIELCTLNDVCLPHIGLPQEMLQMFAAFSETVYCPCTKQPVFFVPNANGKNVHLQTVEIPNANGKNVHLKTKITTEMTNKDIDKGMNDSRQQQDSHSFTPSSTSSQKFSQRKQDQKKQDQPAAFSEKANEMYKWAAELHLTYLKRDEKHSKNCDYLVENGIDSLEKLKSLLTHCQHIPFFAGKILNLQNLVNEIPGWLQRQAMVNTQMQGVEWMPVSTEPEPELTRDDTNEISLTIAIEDSEPEAPETIFAESIVVEGTIEVIEETVPASEEIVEETPVDFVVASEPESIEETAQVVEDVIQDDSVTDRQIISNMVSYCKACKADDRIEECLDMLTAIRDTYDLDNAELLSYMSRSRGLNLEVFFTRLQAMLERDFCQVSA